MTVPEDARDAEIIAERCFDMTTGTGSGRLCVAVRKPVQLADLQEDWCCVVEVDDPAHHFTHSTFGMDSMQALTLALKMLQVHVESWREWYSPRLTFAGAYDLL